MKVRSFVLMLMLVFCVLTSQAANLVINPGFEDEGLIDGLPGPAEWWIYTEGSGQEWSWEVNGGPEGHARSGVSFMRIDAGSEEDWPTIQLGQNLIPVDPNTDYYASVWAKDSSDETIGAFGFIVRWFNDSDPPVMVSRNLFRERLTTSQWTRFDYDPSSLTYPIGTGNLERDTDGMHSPDGAHFAQIIFDNWSGVWGNNVVECGPYGTPHPGVLFDDVYFSTEPWTCDYDLTGDLNDDCMFDVLDLAIVLDNWLIDCDFDYTNPACVPKDY